MMSRKKEAQKITRRLFNSAGQGTLLVGLYAYTRGVSVFELF